MQSSVITSVTVILSIVASCHLCADLHMFITGSEVVYFFLTFNINLLPFVLGYAENLQRLSGLLLQTVSAKVKIDRFFKLFVKAVTNSSCHYYHGFVFWRHCVHDT